MQKNLPVGIPHAAICEANVAWINIRRVKLTYVEWEMTNDLSHQCYFWTFLHACNLCGRREKGMGGRARVKKPKTKNWSGKKVEVGNFYTCLLPVKREKEVGSGSICQGQRDRQDSQSWLWWRQHGVELPCHRAHAEGERRMADAPYFIQKSATTAPGFQRRNKSV